MFCTSCGKKVYDGDRFCAHCGAKLRDDVPSPKPVSADIVFNPPFKVEAERRTSEIYRGFAAEKPAEEKPRRTEPVHFDWNLDGFPQETRKTEEVNFNWESVIERRNQQKREEQKPAERHTASVPVVDKIDIRAMQEEAVPASEERVRKPLFVESLFDVKSEDPFFTELNSFLEPEPSAEPEDAVNPQPEGKAEPAAVLEPGMEEILSITDIPDLILPENTEANESTAAVEVQPAEDVAPEGEEMPEILEAEIPETAVEQEPAEEAELKAEEELPLSVEELERELFGEGYKGIGSMAPEEALKSTAQLEKFYTYNKKNEEFQQLLDQEYERLRGMEEARRPDAESLEFTWAGTLFPDNSRLEAEEPKTQAEPVSADTTEVSVPSDTIDFSAVREEARQKKMLEAAAAAAVTASAAEKTPAETAVACDEPAADSEPAPTEIPDAEEEPAVAETPEEEETPAEEMTEDAADTPEAESDAAPCTEDGHDDKAKLRYSDVFPRDAVGSGSDSDRTAAASTAAKVSEVFDEEEDEPKKMNFFVKLIITILVLLLIAEGVILLAKFIAPDSAFSQKADALVETLMDRITGGTSEAGNDGDTDEDGSDAVSGNLTETTYITDLLTEKVELPDSIGEVLEDPELKYDMNQTYEFENFADTVVFENGDWLTDEDGNAVTYAEGILDAVTGYYGQWQATNLDTSLIGINKLEIGEIRTGEEGYYVLCRLTFAEADGDESEEYVTAYVTTSQNSMLVNAIKEETL